MRPATFDRSTEDTAVWKERRRAVRHPSVKATLCRPVTMLETRPWWRGHLRDVSRTGCRLLLRSRLEAGTFVVVRIAPSSRPLPARVVYSTGSSERGWLAGCAFTQSVSEEELETLF